MSLVKIQASILTLNMMVDQLKLDLKAVYDNPLEDWRKDRFRNSNAKIVKSARTLLNAVSMRYLYLINKDEKYYPYLTYIVMLNDVYANKSIKGFLHNIESIVTKKDANSFYDDKDTIIASMINLIAKMNADFSNFKGTDCNHIYDNTFYNTSVIQLMFNICQCATDLDK